MSVFHFHGLFFFDFFVVTAWEKVCVSSEEILTSSEEILIISEESLISSEIVDRRCCVEIFLAYLNDFAFCLQKKYTCVEEFLLFVTVNEK